MLPVSQRFSVPIAAHRCTPYFASYICICQHLHCLFGRHFTIFYRNTVTFPHEHTVQLSTTAHSCRTAQDFPEHYFPGQFRFPKSDFPALIASYNIPPVFSTGGNTRVVCNAWDGLGILLRRLAFPCRFEDMEIYFNIHRSRLKAIFKWVLKHVLQQCQDRMQRLSRSFLTNDRLLQYSAALQSRGCRLRRVFATIDGTDMHSLHSLHCT